MNFPRSFKLGEIFMKMFSVGSLRIVAVGENGIDSLEKILKDVGIEFELEEIQLDQAFTEKIRGSEPFFTLSDSSVDMQLATEVAKLAKSVDIIIFGIIVIGENLPLAKDRDEKIFSEFQSSCDTFFIHTLKESTDFFRDVL